MKLFLKKLAVLLFLGGSLCVNTQFITANEPKCPCNKPRPPAPAPKPVTPSENVLPENGPDVNQQIPNKTLLQQCCRIMLKEAMQLSDMCLVEQISDIMRQIEKMDDEKSARPESEPFIVGSGCCNCDTESVLLAQEQIINALANITVIVNQILDCACDR